MSKEREEAASLRGSPTGDGKPERASSETQIAPFADFGFRARARRRHYAGEGAHRGTFHILSLCANIDEIAPPNDRTQVRHEQL